MMIHFRSALFCSVCFFCLCSLLSFTNLLKAAEDDDNADLKDSPEDKAAAAVLRRWPAAQNIDACEDSDDDDLDNDKDHDAQATDADKEQKKNDNPLANAKEDNALPDALLPENDLSDWTVSVTFTLNDKEFEVLTNDDGVIRYVYQEILTEDAPAEILKSARVAVKIGDFLRVDKVTNEHRTPALSTYVVGVGEKEVYLDEQGKVLKVLDQCDAGLETDEPEMQPGAL